MSTSRISEDAARLDDKITATLAVLDKGIDRADRLLGMARECGFEDLERLLQRDIESIQREVFMLLAVADDKRRVAIAARYRRLGALLPDAPTA
jgi:hypothetical protein